MKKRVRLFLAFLAVLAVLGLLLMPGISSAQNFDNPGKHLGNYKNPNDNQGNQNGISVVPEPLTLFLLGSGLVGLVAFRSKFKK